MSTVRSGAVTSVPPLATLSCPTKVTFGSVAAAHNKTALATRQVSTDPSFIRVPSAKPPFEDGRGTRQRKVRPLFRLVPLHTRNERAERRSAWIGPCHTLLCRQLLVVPNGAKFHRGEDDEDVFRIERAPYGLLSEESQKSDHTGRRDSVWRQ